jgi:hypothetical protein
MDQIKQKAASDPRFAEQLRKNQAMFQTNNVQDTVNKNRDKNNFGLFGDLS